MNPWGLLRAPRDFSRRPFLTKGHELCGAPILSEEAETLGLVTETFPSCEGVELFGLVQFQLRNSIRLIRQSPYPIGGTHDSADAYSSFRGLLHRTHLLKLRYAPFTSLRNLWRRFPYLVLSCLIELCHFGVYFPGTSEFPTMLSMDAVDECRPSFDMKIESDVRRR